jgi:hypothetical protein
MTAPTDQFVDIANRSQEAVTTAVRTWAETMQGFASTFASGPSQLPDMQRVVEQYFDLAGKILAGQRELAQQWASAAVTASDAVAGQARSAAQPAAAHTVNATEDLVDTAAATAARVTADKAAAAGPVVDDVASG